MNASVQGKAAAALKAGAQKIAAGAASRIKINQYMTLYNANRGKGAPRPRIRIQGLPLQVISPALGQGARLAAMGGSASMRSGAITAQNLQRQGKLATTHHWSGPGSRFNARIGTGILTFAPSAAIDIYNSFEQDLRGDSRFNWQKLAVASAKSQSGNLAGLIGGAGAGVGAVAIAEFLGFTLVGAPIILVSLIGGAAVQIIWGGTGMSELAADKAKAAFAN